MPIDPHGKWGLIFDQFLFGTRPPDPLEFRNNRPNATIMHDLATRHPCPLGVIPTACVKWKQNERTKFYGHFHTAPTPNSTSSSSLGSPSQRLMRSCSATQKFVLATECDHTSLTGVRLASQRRWHHPTHPPFFLQLIPHSTG